MQTLTMPLLGITTKNFDSLAISYNTLMEIFIQSMTCFVVFF